MQDQRHPSGWLDRADLLVLAALVAASLVALLPVVFGSSTLFMRDVANFHWPAKLDQARAIRDSALPFIDTWRGGGQPGLGNLNTLALYPTSWLIAAMPTEGARLWAFNAHFWLHLLLAPLAFAFMARELDLQRAGRWFGAAVYSTSGFALSLLGYYNLVAALVLMPLLVGLAMRVAAGSGAGRSLVCLAGCWALLLLAGDPATALVAVVAAVVACFGWAFGWRSRSIGDAPPFGSIQRPQLRSSFLLAGGALVCGGLLVWPQLHEFRLILGESVRTTLGYSSSGVLRGSVPPVMGIDQLLPFALGAPNTLFWASRLHGGAQPLFYSLSFGTLGVTMMVVSLRLLIGGSTDSISGRRRLAAVVGLVWTVAGALLALGSHNPLIQKLVEWQALGWLRFPVKAWWLVALGVGVLAGIALDELRAGGRSAHRACRAASWVGSVLALIYGGFLLTVLGGWFGSWYERVVGGPNAQQVVAEALPRLVMAAVLGFGLSVLVWAISFRRAWGSRAWLGLLLLHAASQLVLMRPVYPTLPADELLSRPPVLAGLPAGTSIVHGSISGGFGRRTPSTDGIELSSVQLNAVRAGYPAVGVSAGVRYRLNRSPEGLDSFRPGLYSQVVRGVEDREKVRLIEALGVEHLISERPVEVSSVRLVERDAGAGAWLYRLPNARPMLAATDWVVAETPQEAFQAILDPAFDPTSSVAIDDGRLVAALERVEARASGEAPNGEPPRIRVVHESRHELELSVQSIDPVVVATDRAYLPRYRVTVDGQAAETLAANVARLAVAVPAGDHQVRFEFDRSGWWKSCVVSVLGLLLLALLVLLRRRWFP